MKESDQTVLLSTHSQAQVLLDPNEDGDPGVTYFPSETDGMWNSEIEKVLPFITFPAADICCGSRSPRRGMWRIDDRLDSQPNILGDCNKLPFCDEVFNSVYLGHGLEHLNDTRKSIAELLRVTKRGGDILIIHPDLQYTAGMDKTHKNEYTIDQFRRFLVDNLDLGFEICTLDTACQNWSFFVHLRKL